MYGHPREGKLKGASRGPIREQLGETPRNLPQNKQNNGQNQGSVAPALGRALWIPRETHEEEDAAKQLLLPKDFKIKCHYNGKRLFYSSEKAPCVFLKVEGMKGPSLRNVYFIK